MRRRAPGFTEDLNCIFIVAVRDPRIGVLHVSLKTLGIIGSHLIASKRAKSRIVVGIGANGLAKPRENAGK